MDGRYLVQYTALITNGTEGPVRGIYDWEVTLRQVGGLYGFYYENTDFTDTTPAIMPFSRIDPNVVMSVGYGRPIASMDGYQGQKNIG
jgi:hypothetical protein